MANSSGGHTPDHDLRSRYRALLDQHFQLGRDLLEMLPLVVIDMLREVLPTTASIVVHGHVTEDWRTVVRVERVLDLEGKVIFDATVGHPDRAIEDLVDRIDTDFLDQLVHLAADDYLGHHTLGGDQG